MKILLISHAVVDQPGSIDAWAYANDHHLHEVKPYKDERLPDASGYDMLIVLGGPQSSLELDKYPYLRDEIACIKQAVAGKKKIIGICLGAQNRIISC